MSRPAIMHKMKNIITRYDNTILLQFVIPPKDTGTVNTILIQKSASFLFPLHNKWRALA